MKPQVARFSYKKSSPFYGLSMIRDDDIHPEKSTGFSDIKKDSEIEKTLKKITEFDKPEE